jgi:hemerythrin-like domain-containing protein
MATNSRAPARRSVEENIFEVLAREHLVLVTLLDRIEAACKVEDCQAARINFDMMAGRLLWHARAEETAVYPGFARTQELEDLTVEAHEEHALIEHKLKELASMNWDKPKWKAKFIVLKELVEHHVEEEESKIFPAARKALTADEAIELAQAFIEAKRDAMGDAADLEAPIDLEVLSKEQLLDRARQAGLETSSSLNKLELVEAISIRR